MHDVAEPSSLSSHSSPSVAQKATFSCQPFSPAYPAYSANGPYLHDLEERFRMRSRRGVAVEALS